MQSGKDTWNELLAIANDGYDRHMDPDDIREMLLKKNDDEALVYAVMQKARSEHYAKHRSEGLIILGIGLVLILSGFLITCFNFHSNRSFTFAMYGLTSVGLGIVFWGLYKIVG